MDDATKLIVELQSRLSELDDKVAAYRTEMVAEFNKYAEQQMSNLPDEDAEKVLRVITDTLSDYPGLNPSSPTASPYMPQSPTLAARRGRSSPPPRLPHTSGKPKDGFKKHHKKERDLSGLLPGYLPLLEDKVRPLHSPPPEKVDGTSITEEIIEGGMKPGEGSTATLTELKDLPQRPELIRRSTTDTTISSLDSGGSVSSAGTRRKSALRRSSSASKPMESPRESRRVRFEFAGAEYFPSSSPILSKVNLAEATYPAGAADISIENHLSAPVDKDYYSSLLDVPGVLDGPNPPPKKVSSTQALRALSKSPLDPNTTWTLVNSESTPDVAMSPVSGGSPRTESRPSTAGSDTDGAPSPSRLRRVESAPATVPSLSVISLSASKAQISDEEEETSDDEELYIRPKSNGRKSVSPLIGTPTLPGRSEPPTRKPGQPATPMPQSPRIPTGRKSPAKFSLMPSSSEEDGDEDEDGDMFEFDTSADAGLKKAAPPRKTAKFVMEDTEEEETEDDDDGTGAEASASTSASLSMLSASPAINIPQRSPNNGSDAAKMSSSTYSKTSVGSLKGKSFTIGPLHDSTLSKEIENGNESPPAFFVGSVSGRSGLDSSNANSYRATMAGSINGKDQTGGVPGSLSERLNLELAMEKLEEERKKGGRRK